MLLPNLTEMPTSREWLDIFLGYNHNLRISEGEFYEMKNMSGDDYPILSPRAKRGVYKTTGSPRGLVSKDALCYVDNGTLYIGDQAVADFALNDEDKTFVSMGAYLIILPDKKYINTTNHADKGSIEAQYVSTAEVKIELAKANGEAYGEAISQDSQPESPNNRMLWIDTSSVPHVLKQYSSATSQWVSLSTTYVKISAVGIGTRFAVGDGIELSGFAEASLNGANIVSQRDDNYIVITGLIETNSSQEDAVTVSRRMPQMDFIIESENRLWGCRSGTAADGTTVNEIYACKLGDFKNWNCFAGLVTDSYAVSVGTDGAFTGAIKHLGYPMFFKEGCVHKIYGSFPSNFQVQTTPLRGVQRGCEKSLAIVNEVLYYKARGGICAYDGSLPSEISKALGDIVYEGAVAGAVGNKYYISMRETGTERYSLFVYDTAKGLWHREDDTQAKCFCNHENDLFYIDYADHYIKSVKGAGVEEYGNVKWEVTTGTIGTDSPDKKYISRIDVRLKLAVGSRVIISAEYDSDGEWHQLSAMTGVNLRSFAIPIKPRRCDHLRLRIMGSGEAKIYSICKTIELGSDV